LWQLAVVTPWFILITARARAAEQSSVHSPLPPQESLAHIVVADGLKVELVAHEPSVIDPVEIRFDEDGRMWVVEMRDYPTGPPDGKGLSRISVLEDRDEDGFFESATVFADDLHFATGLQPWKGGVFVTLAGEVAYMKDATGDGRADHIETWFRGFAQQNTQLRANHPRFALDNHIYVANGLRGGAIFAVQLPHRSPLSISGMDFRFDPFTRACEPVSGAGQFGLTFDDYGNRFVCTNRNPAIHVVLEDRFLKKHPLVSVAAVTHDVAKAGDESCVLPITRAWTTSNLHAGQFTAACGLEIYRGDALPAEFYGNIFVCEPTGHLVHREVMKPHGVTFTSTPAYDNAEFFASRDEWCCPVNLEVGPDGALYVVDMYRAVIEHPEWMPTELRQRPDLLAGNDRGRIYRVVRKGFLRPAQPQLSNVPSGQLIQLLAHPNAWWRQTAARLLVERQNQGVAPQLQHVALHDASHVARIHALRVLQSFDLVSAELLRRLLQDPDPRVVEQAIAVAEATGQRGTPSSLTAWQDARVRFLALLTGAVVTDGPPSERTDSWEALAYLIASRAHGGSLLVECLQDQRVFEANVVDPKQFIAALARLRAATNDGRQTAVDIDALLNSPTYRRVGLASFFRESRRYGHLSEDIRRRLPEPTRRTLDVVFEAARADAVDTKSTNDVRREAIDLLAESSNARLVLAPLALSDPDPVIRAHVIKVLPVGSGLAVWRQLLANYVRETPMVQVAIIQSIFASSPRTALLLDAIAAAQLQPAALGAERVNQLLNHHDDEIGHRARQLLADTVPADRHHVLAEYKPVLSMSANAARGQDVFAKHCATCHRIADVGTDIAPDISDSREKSAEQLLTDVLQPNRAVDANYFSYTAITTDGRVLTGILTTETSTSITMKQAEGKTITLRRDEIDELQSSGVSFMPDGFEKLISKQEMADLISFIKNWRYLDESLVPAGR
jgi:putative membrane-bound dehydrogenase-like protein